MSLVSKLQVLAISSAKSGDWQKAVEINTEILSQTPDDTQALNRLGLAHIQLGQLEAATETFKKTLAVDKNNSIALKQLERIKTNQTHATPSFSKNHFIEEPGKTKIVELHRLSGKQVLDGLSVGQSCQLKLKNRYISVETNEGTYIGALPEDVSFRLTKLIQTGNEYHCSIHSCSNNVCTTYLKETLRSAQNIDTHSFPPTKTPNNHLELDDRYLMENGDDEDGTMDLDDDEVAELDSSREDQSEPQANFEE
ncbi:tetratricopeptide repeat protein [Candidatus Woesebacteria bacterium]|nr:tetratricopeptide repeat protein [Candidatus Woesebacteria bacterium]